MSTKYALINNENLTVAKVGDQIEALELWATRLCGFDDFSIIDINERKGLALYTPMELSILYRHLTGDEITRKSYQDQIKSVHVVINQLPIDDTTAKTIESWFLKPPDHSDIPVDERDRRYRNKQHGVKPLGADTTPSEKGRSATTMGGNSGAGTSTGGKPKGGTTARVWAIADEVKETVGTADMKALRKAIVVKCVSEGINTSTASTQYGKWKRDQNL